jgi:hypothetical protein
VAFKKKKANQLENTAAKHTQIKGLHLNVQFYPILSPNINYLIDKNT